jgi:two-component sensor histidine kinase
MHIVVRELAERRLPGIRRDPWLRWAVGCGLFALAFVLRWALENVLPAGLPFITFFVAVLAAGLVGGATVGLAVLGLSFVSSWFFFIAPRYSFHLEGSSATALLVFALFGMAIVAITHELNITVERLLAERRRSDELLQKSTQAEEKLAQLNRELLHRIRNIFTVATSIATQTSRYVADPAEMANALASRFQALAVAQELLVANDLVGADLQRLAAETLKPMAPDPERLNVTGPSIQLPAEATTSLCLVLHELATNAVKYGAWSNGRGKVDFAWSVGRDGADPVVVLRWRESDGPHCGAPAKTGLGSVLIDNAVSGATVQRQFLPGGLDCSIRFAHPTT